jgi:hypothetical protein
MIDDIDVPDISAAATTAFLKSTGTCATSGHSGVLLIFCDMVVNSVDGEE